MHHLYERPTTPLNHRTRIGLIGLGSMGAAIAERLLQNDIQTAFLSRPGNTNQQNIESLGARPFDSIQMLTNASDVVLLALPGPEQVEQVCHGPSGLLACASEGLMVIDTTTSSPELSASLGKAFSERSAHYVDAPLTRGPSEARSGTLNVLLGADPALVRQVSSVLFHFAESVFHVGEVGAGQKVKLLNNFLSMGIVGLTAELLSHAWAVGVPAETLSAVMARGGVNNQLTQGFLQWTIDGTPALAFSIGNASKDLKCCLDMLGPAADSRLLLPLYERFAQSVEQGKGALNLPYLFDHSPA